MSILTTPLPTSQQGNDIPVPGASSALIGKLGDSFLASVGKPQVSVDCKADSHVALAMNLTLFAAINDSSFPIGTVASAIIEFGNRVQAFDPIEVAVNTGLTMCLPGSYCRVTHKLDSSVGTTKMRMGGFVGLMPLTRNPMAPVMAKSTIQTLHPGDIIDVPRPPFSSLLSVGFQDFTTGLIEVSFFNGSGRVVDYIRQPNEVFPWLPIPPMCTHIEILNLDAVNVILTPLIGLDL